LFATIVRPLAEDSAECTTGRLRAPSKMSRRLLPLYTQHLTDLRHHGLPVKTKTAAAVRGHLFL